MIKHASAHPAKLIANLLQMGHKHSKTGSKSLPEVAPYQSPADILRETTENARAAREASHLMKIIGDIQQAADRGEFSINVTDIASVRTRLLELFYHVKGSHVEWTENGTCCFEGRGQCAFCLFHRTHAYNNMKYAHEYERLHKRMEAASGAGESQIICEDPIPVGLRAILHRNGFSISDDRIVAWDADTIDLNMKKYYGRFGFEIGSDHDGRCIVVSIDKGMPAELSGLLIDDVIIGINDVYVQPYENVARALQLCNKVKISVRRAPVDDGITDV